MSSKWTVKCDSVRPSEPWQKAVLMESNGEKNDNDQWLMSSVKLSIKFNETERWVKGEGQNWFFSRSHMKHRRF